MGSNETPTNKHYKYQLVINPANYFDLIFRRKKMIQYNDKQLKYFIMIYIIHVY